MKSASINDVARLAGVSTATVSHVINKTRIVSKETTEKVEAAIRQLNYRPNTMARNLRTGRTGEILFIVPDIGSVFFTSIIEALENTLSEQDYQLVLANTHESWEREKEYLRLLNRSNFDGLILATTQTEADVLTACLPADMPTVLVDRKLAGLNMNCVWVTSYRAVYDSVLDLAKQGHQKIGYIAGVAGVSTSQERLQAYQDAMAKLQLEPYIERGNSLPSSSPACFSRLIKRGCTAIVISNETMTDDALIYMYSQQPEIRRQVTVCGYRHDNARYSLADYAIIQPSGRMGVIAGERILELISSPETETKEVRLKARRDKGRAGARHY